MNKRVATVCIEFLRQSIAKISGALVRKPLFCFAMTRKNASDLRTGFTTGACATAAAKAALIGLLSGKFPKSVQITLPRGQKPEFELAEAELGDGWARVAVQKDAGDDPDVTHGVLIIVTLCRSSDGIVFKAGSGVGMVTKPGLKIPPGEPAINPVPRQMITEHLIEIAAANGVAADFEVEISVPGGEEIAKQTWNPRLGILGGISILGTTGIVRPFSCSAWIASIHQGIDVARATGVTHAVAATGATSEKVAQACFDLPDHAMLDMGDFAGGVLKYIARNPLPRLTIAGGFGKMVKLSQGALDLHSSRSQVDFGALAKLAENDAVLHANTAAHALEISGKKLAERVAENAKSTAMLALKGAPVLIDILIIDRAANIIARTS